MFRPDLIMGGRQQDPRSRLGRLTQEDVPDVLMREDVGMESAEQPGPSRTVVAIENPPTEEIVIESGEEDETENVDSDSPNSGNCPLSVTSSSGKEVEDTVIEIDETRSPSRGDNIHLVDLAFVEAIHTRKRVVSVFENLVDWMAGVTGKRLKMILDQFGIGIIVYRGNKDTESTSMDEFSELVPDGFEDRSATCSVIMQTFVDGIKIPSRVDTKNFWIISTKTPGFTEKEIRAHLDDTVNPNIMDTLNYLLKKNMKNFNYFTDLYNLDKAIWIQ